MNQVGSCMKGLLTFIIMVITENVLKITLSMYMQNHETKDLVLPSHEEVLICTKHTTEEEVILLWRRALDDPEHKRIFCLVHAELLSYQVWDKALYIFQQFSSFRSGIILLNVHYHASV